jgi:putative intracellular protease/amidase
MLLIARRAASVVLGVVLAVLTLGGIAVAGTATVGRHSAPPPAAAGQDWPAPRPSSTDGEFVVAVALGQTGTVGSDVLAPYEVFASSPEFSVYTVAATAAPVSLTGGPGLVPAHTFADVDSGAAPAPDVVVVPAVGDPTGAAEAPLRDWIIRQSARGAHLLGVCSGSRVLAATGLLDGHRATSHWSGISALEQSNPTVQWVRGERYVQDGRITTTAGVSSGVPGALRVMADLAGAAQSERVGRAVGYPDWSLTAPTSIPVQHFAVADLPVGLNAVLPWLRPVVGVGLTDGVGEIDVAAAFEVYSMSAAARTVAVAAHPAVTTRHGVVLVAAPSARGLPALDRVIVPGATSAGSIDPRLASWAADRDVPLDPLSGAEGRAGFDAALDDLAAHTDRATAVSAAKLIDYPTTQQALPAGGQTWRTPVLLVLALLVAVGVGLLPTTVRRLVRRRRAHTA